MCAHACTHTLTHIQLQVLNSEKRFPSGLGRREKCSLKDTGTAQCVSLLCQQLRRLRTLGELVISLAQNWVGNKNIFLKRVKFTLGLVSFFNTTTGKQAGKKGKEKCSYINSRKKKGGGVKFKTWSLFTIKKPARPGPYHLVMILFIQTVRLTSVSALERNALEGQEGHISHITTILVWGKTSSASPHGSFLFWKFWGNATTIHYLEPSRKAQSTCSGKIAPEQVRLRRSCALICNSTLLQG